LSEAVSGHLSESCLILAVTVCAVYCEPFLYTVHYNAVQVMHIADVVGGINEPP